MVVPDWQIYMASSWLRTPSQLWWLLRLSVVALTVLNSAACGNLSTGTTNDTASSPDEQQRTRPRQTVQVNWDSRSPDEALRSALEQAQDSAPANVVLPPGEVELGSSHSIPDGVTLLGSGDRLSVLLYNPERPPEQGARLLTLNSRSGLQNISLRRATDKAAVLVGVSASTDAFVRHVALDGGDESWGSECHGIQLVGGSPATIRNLIIEESSFSHLSYGLLTASANTPTVDGVTVARSHFTRNGGSDLEFNAPHSLMARVSVLDNSFSDNRSGSTNAGWAIGLANVAGALVARNSFANYRLNALHVEDGSQRVQITDNHFQETGTLDTGFASDIIILSGSHEVSLSSNTFSYDGLEPSGVAIWIGHGGSERSPHDIIIRDNKTVGDHPRQLMALHGANGVTSDDNR